MFKQRIKIILLALGCLSLLAGCLSGESGRKGRPLIQDLATYDGEEEEATPVPEVTPTPTPYARPANNVSIQNGQFCSCLNGKTDIENQNCAAICAGTSTTEPTLYVTAKVGPDIELDPDLGTLQNWCTKEIEGVQANCILEATDDTGAEYPIPITFTAGNKFTAKLTALTYDKRYVVYLVEKISGLKSNAFQIRRVEPEDTSNISDTTLRVMNISQYTCMDRTGETLSGYNWFFHTARTHYYFPQNDKPPTLPPGNDYQLCHDIQAAGQGSDDSPLYSRLEEIPGVFALWDSSDPRFYDLDNDGNLDANNVIKTKLEERGFTQSSVPQIFAEFAWLNYPGTGDGGATAMTRMGFYMQPWLKTDGSGYSFCPTRDNYEDSTNAMFNVIGDLVGKVDTEGVYFAVREPIEIRDSNGAIVTPPSDILIIRDSLLQRIWFYYEDGLHHEPDEFAAARKTIMFYWPPDLNEPRIRKSNQVIYTIRSSSATQSETGTDTTGLRSTIAPPDHKFGCVPVIPLNVNDTFFSPPATSI